MKNIDVNHNVISYYGNKAGYIKDGKAVADPIFRTDELTAYLTEKENLTIEWTNGVYDRLASGTALTDGNAVPLKDCRIWQLKPDSDIMMRFIGYDDLTKGGYGEPDPENYRVVYDGQLETNNLDEIYDLFNTGRPHGFEGHSLSMSDVIELYDESVSEYHYVNTFGFRAIHFDAQPAEQENNPVMSI